VLASPTVEPQAGSHSREKKIAAARRSRCAFLGAREIRDRNGITLVANRASYEVDFYLPAMVKGFKDQNKWCR